MARRSYSAGSLRPGARAGATNHGTERVVVICCFGKPRILNPPLEVETALGRDLTQCFLIPTTARIERPSSCGCNADQALVKRWP